jgi:ATP-dependent helicase/nuclease subunit B
VGRRGERGIIDRIDRMPTSESERTELINYKTGSALGLREKLRRPQEDTQLAFYAALVTPGA